LFLDDAGDLLRDWDRVFALHLALYKSQVERATCILHKTVERHFQQFTYAHAAFLKDQNHLHPWCLQVPQMRI
jgi:hypothetical protein